ncbi:multidrug resistance protein [Penicillium odoratum]|uniref:multidrug resistance protein n=1 Tax=Penicillium odoratum TaxID=1167516 RepID=UPI0025477E8E|nr:multidrug resistance protein [Penicillium odoratum]KAJ5772369.1 multidrug resistance protein [Penicillium odoratum]
MDPQQNACFQADSSFGPVVSGCRDDFDFTLAFELYFFLIAPAALFLLIAPTRLYLLFARDRCVDGLWLRNLKLALTIGYAALQLTLIALWAVNPMPASAAGIAASCLCTGASMFLALLSSLEHTRTLRPSSIVNAYLLSTFLDAVVVRTLWLASYVTEDLRNVFTAAFTLKACLLIMEAVEKRRFFCAEQDRALSPYARSSIYNRAVFWWVNELLRQGARQTITPKDLHLLESSMAVETLDRRIWASWQKTDQKHRRRLIHTFIRALRWDLLTPLFPRLLLIAFTVGQPLCLRRFLEYLEASPEQSANVGYGMIGAYFLIYLGIAISTGFYWSSWFRSLALIRSMLMTAIFERTLQSPASVATDKAAVTLMSTEVDRIMNGLREIHELWANALQIIIATYLLETELQYACIAPAITALGSFIAITYLSEHTKKFQKQWMGKLQLRVGRVSAMLDSIKGIKISGLTDRLFATIAALRQEEVDASKKFRLLGAFTSTIALLPQILSPVLAFAIYAAVTLGGGRSMDVSRLFTSLSILSLLSQPLFAFFGSIVNSRSAIGCFERIEDYLCQHSFFDGRICSGDAVSVTNSIEKDSSLLRKTEVTELDVGNQTLQPASVALIQLDKVSLGWFKDKDPLLTNINLSIKRGTSNFIVGPSGAGKTTLLYALLGECPIINGTIATTVTDIAWCEQTPWLVNQTIRDNILSGSALDETLLSTIIHCCDLKQDLDSLPAGDQTRIGNKGTALSGGQKQRIALARAIYSRKEMVLLDDPLSGLDVTTENNIICRCFGKNGLFSRWGTTVVMATHSSRLLPSADQIFVLDSKGSVSECGTYQELMATEGYLHKTHGHKLSSLQQESATDFDKLGQPTEKYQGQMNTSKKRILVTPNIYHDTQKTASKPHTAKEKIISDSSVYRFYVKAIGITPLMTFLALEAVWAFLSVFPVQWLKWWAEDSTSHGNKDLGVYLGVYAALQVAALASSALATWFAFSFMARKSGLSLHSTLLRATLSAPLSLFAKQDSGEILTRFSQDIQMVDMSLPLQILTLTQNLFTCIAQAGLIGSGVGWIAVSYPALIANCKANEVVGFFTPLGGLPTIRAFKWQARFRNTNYDLVTNAQKPWYSLLIIQRWLLLVLDLVTAALTVLIVGIAVKLRSSTEMAGVAVALVQIITLSNYLNQVVNTYTMLETTLGAIARIKKFEDDVVAMPGNTISDHGIQPPPSWPDKGEVVLEHVSASYEDTAEQSDRPALNGVTIHIQPGQKIGYVAERAMGRSSTVLALFRLLDLNSGTILVDRQDLATLNQETVRSRLNGLGQDPYFLAGSVRLNLDPYQDLTKGEDSNDARLIQALDTMQLWSLIEQNGGLDVELKKESLSHGQRQLFCIARALLRPGKIVILDEITSSVDLQMDKLIQAVITSEFADRTIIVIAHRLNTIVNCDRVAVMADGKCVEFDDPKVLLEKKDSFFRALLKSS